MSEFPTDRIDILEAMRSVDARVREVSRPDDAFAAIASEVKKITKADMASVVMLDAASNSLKVVAYSGLDEAIAKTLPPIPTDPEFRKQMAAQREPKARRFSSAEEIPVFLKAYAKAVGFDTVVITSIVTNRGVIGYLSIAGKSSSGEFPRETELLMESVAAHTAVALELVSVSIELRRAKADAERILALAPVGILRCDSKGIVKGINKQMLGMLDMSSESEIVGTSVFEHSPVARSPLEGLVMQGMDGHDGEKPDLHLVLRPDKAIYLHARVTPLKSDAGAVEGVLLVALDITSKVRLQNQLERSYEKLTQTYQELERVNKMKSQFIDVVSHELRTPLTVMRGYIDLVESDYSSQLDARFSARLRTIKANTDKLYTLVESMLDVSRLEKGSMETHPEPVRIDTILEEIVASRKHDADEKRQALTLDVEGKLPLIMADRRRLKDVFNNLVDNAIKYTQEGGKIGVFARDEGRMIHVWVRDNGIGIPLEQLGKIFDRFHIVATDDLSHQVNRLGLGLPIAKGIVEAHGGRIWVESQVGKGSAFHVDLPKEQPK